MKAVCIGIVVYTEPERLRATLASVTAHTGRPHELVLLPDGPDPACSDVLAMMGDLIQSGTSEALGSPACFNRLVSEVTADVYVLLESGCVVGPAWLDNLLAALAADPRNGLAGPSTNSAWNAQGAFPRDAGTLAEVARTAQEAAARFHGRVRTLEPLYSLADFCYAVRREVIDAVGAADEGYGLGPCWEMDYNIRAARAGWHGVWACAAYVYRAPFTARRRREEAARFEASKRRYQDKFCGARLRGDKKDYRAHCRGDACPNFAPSSLITFRREWPVRSAPHAQLAAAGAATHTIVSRNATVTEQRSVLPTTVSVQQEPLATCIMPTNNRRGFVAQAIRVFLRQDYANCELLVVDDGTDAVADCIPEHHRIRYLRLDRKLSLGAKRNFACGQARGEFIIHWDDDDWYPSWRVRAQVHTLLERSADVCGSSRACFYDPIADRAWDYQYRGPGGPWVAGSTLAYRRRFWERNGFADLQIGEDSRFVWSAEVNAVADMAEPMLCVATVHKGNTSRKETHGAFWRPLASTQVRRVLGDERYAYLGAAALAEPKTLPLVSCIMPTYNRRFFLPLGLQLFLAQDYPNKELIIVDDGSDCVADVVKNIPAVHYARLPTRSSIGAKRNFACQLARGTLIAHWDDDDWYAADRLRYQ